MLTLITQANKNLKWELLLPWYFSYVVWTQLLSKKQNAQDKKTSYKYLASSTS